MKEIIFRYSTNNKHIILSIFCCILALLSIFGGFLLINYNESIALTILVIGFILFFGIPIYLIITAKNTEKTGNAVIRDDYVEINILKNNYLIYYNEILKLNLDKVIVKMGRYSGVWFYVYVLNIFTKNKQLKIKASIEESREKYENEGDVTLKILYNYIYNKINNREIIL